MIAQALTQDGRFERGLLRPVVLGDDEGCRFFHGTAQTLQVGVAQSPLAAQFDQPPGVEDPNPGTRAISAGSARFRSSGKSARLASAQASLPSRRPLPNLPLAPR